MVSSRPVKNRVLIVEDDTDMVFLLRRLLEGADYEVETVSDGQSGLNFFNQGEFDLLILDVNLPLMDGLDVCRRVRQISLVPILMLSCHREDYDKVVGLETGADDYLGKPFSPAELLARVKALLRRSSAFESREVISLGGLRLFTASHEVFCDQDLLCLTPIEFSLLEELMRRAGDAISRADLLMAIWGQEFQGYTRTIDTHIQNLRKKLPAACRARIESVRGVGFKLVETTN